MKILNSADKRIIYGAASVQAKPRAATKKSIPKRRKSAYIGRAIDDFMTTASSSKFSKEKKIKVGPDSKVYKSFSFVNKAGLTTLAIASVLNHTTNTALKIRHIMAGGDPKHFNDKANTYLKPSFAIPSQWSNSRVFFGTPWHY